MDFEIEDYAGYFTMTRKNSSNYNKSQIIVYSSPTGNCQLACVNCFNGISGWFKTDADVKDFFSTIEDKTGKAIALLDLNRHVYDDFIKGFPFIKEHIMMESHYESTNDSNMVIVLVQTDM